MARRIAHRLRKAHRWVSVAAFVILAWNLVTGIALAIDVLLQPPLPPRYPRTLPKADLPTLAASSLAHSATGKSHIRGGEVTIRLSATNGLIAVVGSEASNLVAFDPMTGETRAMPSPPPPLSEYVVQRMELHKLLERLHRGTFLGKAGGWLSLLGGLSLLFLLISGSWMYVDLLVQRARQGKKALFWS